MPYPKGPEVLPSATVSQLLPYEIKFWMLEQDVPNFSQKARGITLIDADMIHIRELNSCFAQQNAIASDGKPAQCFTRRKRSSFATTRLPSRSSATEESA